MADWEKKLNDILTINDREVLMDAGRISKQQAENKAEKEFEKYTIKQKALETAAGLKELENELMLLKK